MRFERDTLDGSIQQRLKRLKFVTENFQNLQGLMQVVVGALLLLIRTSEVIEPGWLGSLFLLVVGVVYISILRNNSVAKYYERRFGRFVRQSIRRPARAGDEVQPALIDELRRQARHHDRLVPHPAVVAAGTAVLVPGGLGERQRADERAGGLCIVLVSLNAARDRA